MPWLACACSRIVEDWGTRIELISNADGRGARIGFVAATSAIGHSDSNATRKAKTATTSRLGTRHACSAPVRARTPGTSSGTAATRTTNAGNAGIAKRQNEPSSTRALTYVPLRRKKTVNQTPTKIAARRERTA